MNIFIDTFLLEGPQKYRVGKTTVPYFKKNIDSELMYFSFIAEQKDYGTNSIIPVSRIFISKEFNLDEAWNRFEYVYYNMSVVRTKRYYLREGILKSLYIHLYIEDLKRAGACTTLIEVAKKSFLLNEKLENYSYKALKALIKKYGYTLKEIAAELNAYTNYGLDLYKNMIKLNSDLRREFYSAETINNIDVKNLYISYNQDCSPEKLSSLLGNSFKNLTPFKVGSLVNLEELVVPYLSSSSVSKIFYPEENHNVCQIFDSMRDDVKIDYFVNHRNHPMNNINNSYLTSRCNKIRETFYLLKPYIDNQFKL